MAATVKFETAAKGHWSFLSVGREFFFSSHPGFGILLSFFSLTADTFFSHRRQELQRRYTLISQDHERHTQNNKNVMKI